MNKNRVKAYVKVGSEIVGEAVTNVITSPEKMTGIFITGLTLGLKYKGSWGQALKGISMAGSMFTAVNIAEQISETKNDLLDRVKLTESLYEYNEGCKSTKD